jgi:hypothetical protein
MIGIFWRRKFTPQDPSNDINVTSKLANLFSILCTLGRNGAQLRCSLDVHRVGLKLFSRTFSNFCKLAFRLQCTGNWCCGVDRRHGGQVILLQLLVTHKLRSFIIYSHKTELHRWPFRKKEMWLPDSSRVMHWCLIALLGSFCSTFFRGAQVSLCSRPRPRFIRAPIN